MLNFYYILFCLIYYLKNYSITYSRLFNECAAGIENCQSLERLSLVGNPLTSVSDLAPLSSLPRLTHLTLKDPSSSAGIACPLVTSFTSPAQYRQAVFTQIPHLRSLDGMRRSLSSLPTAAAVEKQCTASLYKKFSITPPNSGSAQNNAWVRPGGFVFRPDLLSRPETFISDALQRAKDTISRAGIPKEAG